MLQLNSTQRRYHYAPSATDVIPPLPQTKKGERLARETGNNEVRVEKCLGGTLPNISVKVVGTMVFRDEGSRCGINFKASATAMNLHTCERKERHVHPRKIAEKIDAARMVTMVTRR